MDEKIFGISKFPGTYQKETFSYIENLESSFEAYVGEYLSLENSKISNLARGVS